MIIAHIDMDCFYCSCEEKKDHSIKGKPVIVGSTGQRGVASAANYEARKYGVFSATPISVARRLCPEGIFLPVDFTYYHEESDKIMEILESISKDIEQVSVDEAYIDVTEYAKKFKDLDTMARFIQALIKKKTGLTCSVGIANSRYVAKIASDFNKPNGVTVVEDTKKFLAGLPIGKMPGIGKVSKEYYEDNGIFKIGDLANLDRYTLIKKFGQGSIHFQDIALGLDNTGILEYAERKSVSREWTFQQDTSDTNLIEGNLKELCNEVYDDLSKSSFRKVSIKIRYTGFITTTRDRTLFAHTRDKNIFLKTVLELFRESKKGDIRLIGVKVSDISNEIQLTLDHFI